jgi:hypothetical protein
MAKMPASGSSPRARRTLFREPIEISTISNSELSHEEKLSRQLDTCG